MFKDAFSTDISKEQAKDTGMAMVLILLLVGFFTGNILFYKLAIPVLLLDMIYPMIFYPVAIVWLGLSHLLGTIMSKVLLTIVFTVIVLPIGFIRKMTGKDSLKLKKFGAGKETVMNERNYVFTAADLEKPY